MMNPLIRKDNVHNQHIPILIFTLIAILIGVFLAPDYGESWDEDMESWYGKTALRRAYGYEVEQWNEAAGPTGPAFFMVNEIFTLFMEKISPGVPAMYFRHFGYYITFILAAIALYYLSLKISNRISAVFASLLFFFQPLLFGHAFINPKDIPFMSGSIIVVTLGIYAIDQSEGTWSGTGIEPLRELRGIWKKSTQKTRVGIIITLLVSITVTLELLVFHRVFLHTILRITSDAYHSQAFTWINQLFNQLAQNRAGIPMESYLWKITRLYWAVRLPVVICLLAIPAMFLIKKCPNSFLGFVHSSPQSRWLFTGMLLGFLMSMRLIGVFFGLLLSVYVLILDKRHTIRCLPVFWVSSLLFMILLQPYFWDTPLQTIPASIQNIQSFQWNGIVLFDGSLLHGEDLPGSYNPLILLRQLTLPVLLLGMFGGVRAFIAIGKRWQQSKFWLLIFLWLIVPVVAAMLFSPAMYDNCRQFMFVLPPLFVFAAYAFDMVFGNKCLYKFAILSGMLAFLPGLIGILQLHPYEYIFFNSFEGGVQSSFRQQELDYWCISSREAIEYINIVAPEDAHIDISIPLRMVEGIARPDLRLHPVRLNHPDSIYALLCTRANKDLVEFPETPIEWAVSRDGAYLTVVKRIR